MQLRTYVNKDIITVYFGWILWNFLDKFFLTSLSECFCSFKAFTRFFLRFDTEQYYKKSRKSHLKITVMGFFFSKLQVVTELKKGLHHSFFRVNILWNFSDQLYCKTSQVEYYSSFQAFMRFDQCSERSHSIYLSKFGQFPMHSSATAIIIRLTKQLKIPYMQSVGAVIWNSSPEKESRNIAFSQKPLSLVW